MATPEMDSADSRVSSAINIICLFTITDPGVFY
jgi:hypothetical protein